MGEPTRQQIIVATTTPQQRTDQNLLNVIRILQSKNEQTQQRYDLAGCITEADRRMLRHG